MDKPGPGRAGLEWTRLDWTGPDRAGRGHSDTARTELAQIGAPVRPAMGRDQWPNLKFGLGRPAMGRIRACGECSAR